MFFRLGIGPFLKNSFERKPKLEFHLAEEICIVYTETKFLNKWFNIIKFNIKCVTSWDLFSKSRFFRVNLINISSLYSWTKSPF